MKSNTNTMGEYSGAVESQKNNEDSELRLITSRVLTPEGIDSYVDDALGDLTAYLDTITADYLGSNAADSSVTGLELERSALVYKNQDPEFVNSTLDNIESLVEGLKIIDSTILVQGSSSKDFIPTAKNSALSIIAGSGNFEGFRSAPKIKSLLFVLQQDFSLDISADSSDVSVEVGRLVKDRIREAPYTKVTVPSLDRVVYINDEIGNKTFVLNSGSPDFTNMDDYTKQQLDDYIESGLDRGEAIKFNNVSFIPKLKESLGIRDSSDEYLVPSAPEGFLTLNGISKDLGMQTRRQALQRIIDSISDQIGPVNTYMFRKPALGYSPAQVASIKECVLSAESSGLDEAPDDIVSLNGLNQMYGNRAQLARIIEELGDRLGEVRHYSFKNRAAPGYTPQQVAMILEYRDQNFETTTEMTDDMYSVSDIVELFDDTPSKSFINNVVYALKKDSRTSAEFGEVARFRQKGRNAPISGYTPEQVQMIVEKARSRGASVARSLAKKAISGLRDELEGK